MFNKPQVKKDSMNRKYMSKCLITNIYPSFNRLMRKSDYRRRLYTILYDNL